MRSKRARCRGSAESRGISGTLSSSTQFWTELVAVPPLEYVPTAVQPMRSKVFASTLVTDHWSFTSSDSPTMPKMSTIFPLVKPCVAAVIRTNGAPGVPHSALHS